MSDESQSPYKEAALALTDFLSSALRFMTIYVTQEQPKKKLLQLSDKVKRAGSTKEITALKKEYRKIILSADPPSASDEKKGKSQNDRSSQSISPPAIKEPVSTEKIPSTKNKTQDSTSPENLRISNKTKLDVGLMEESELLGRFLRVLSKLLGSLKGKFTGDDVKMKIDSLVERLPKIKRLGEMEEFEKNVQESIYRKTFMDEKVKELYEDVFDSMMESTHLWVEKNSIMERRLQTAMDSQFRTSDPWLLRDLATSIKSFFFSKKQEVFILGRERENLKSIIISLVRTLQDVAERNHLFMDNMGKCTEAMEKAEEVRDFEKVKSSIVFEVGKLRKKTEGLEGEINKIKVKLLSARSAIRSLEEVLEKAKEESLRDPLTGVFSRTALEDKLAEQVLLTQKTHESFGMLLCDMDRFSAINSRYGNAVGDEVLKALVKDLGTELREEDFLARFGGNCFAMVRRKMGGSDLKASAERVLDAIQSHEFLLKSKKISVTASVAAVIVTEKDTVESAINHLRELLQEVKKHGGNRYALGALES